MPNNTISSGQYLYQHNCKGELIPAVDIHDIFINKTNRRALLTCLCILMVFLHVCYLLVTKDMPAAWQNLLFLLIIFLVASRKFKQVKKECVIILPGFGVQLETHYRSGSVHRQFVPIGKIVRPVLNECVTPVTCYWSLSLILHDEDQLLLVFKELQPPVKMLVPIWKALCAAVDCKEPDM